MNQHRCTALVLAIAGLFALPALAAEASLLPEHGALMMADAASGSVTRALAFAGIPDLLGNSNLTRFMSTEMGDGGKVVKDAPYTAEAVSETTQYLSDGNRISRKSATLLYRDAQGRTRQEQTAPGSTVFINDPVAGKRTVLNADKKSATVLPDFSQLLHSIDGDKMSKAGRAHIITKSGDGEMQILRKSRDGDLQMQKSGESEMRIIRKSADGETQIINEPGRQIVIRRKEVIGPEGAKGTEERKEMRVSVVRSHDGEEAISIAGLPMDLNRLMNFKVGKNKGVTTSLGSKDMGGIRADGTQTIVTIPAGEIGNEKPIQIISEKWVSPELQTVVYSRHSDPRSGETIYKLGNIRRVAPSPDLFSIPQGYKIKETPMPPLPPLPPIPPLPPQGPSK